MRSTARGLCAAALLPTGVALAQPGFQFVDVTAARGMHHTYIAEMGMNSGVAAADFDNDGYIDVFLPTAEGIPNRLYRNLGDGTFEEIAASANLNSTRRTRVALWIDYDGDGLLDLITAGDCFMSAQANCYQVNTLQLYRQTAPGVFQRTTTAAGLLDTADLITSNDVHRSGLAAADINNDGYIDIYTTTWAGKTRLLLNDGDGTFTDISATSGVANSANNWQPVFHDFDRDGFIDIFQAVDFNANILWMNQGNNTFVNKAAAAGVNLHPWNNMGVALGDYDNDRDFDIYVTEVTKDLGLPTERYCILYRNDSVGSTLAFTEVAKDVGVHNAWWGWGATWLDADNDTRLDLAMTNGFANLAYGFDPSKFFHQNAAGTFDDVSDLVGFNDTYWGSTVIALDYDRDGDLDMIQTCMSSDLQGGPVRLLENELSVSASEGNYLVVQPRMAGPNRFAIGAVVHLYTRDQNGTYHSQSRLITAGTSMLGQEPYEAFFGLKDATQAAVVIVEWPDGTFNARALIPANQVIQITRPAGDCPGDVTGDGLLNALDSAAFKELVMSRDPLGDCNNDGIVNLADWYCWKTIVQNSIQAGGCN